MSQKLKQTIVQTAIYYGRNLDQQVLEMMADDLSDLDPEVCVAGYAQYRRNPKNKTFPLPAQIRELVNPEQFVSVETRAREIAARIVGAIPKFGWNNSREAQVFIGPEGWAAVERAGGWMHLCQNTGVTIQPTTLQAQLRDQLEGSLRYGTPAIEKSIGAKPLGLTRIGDVMRLISQKNNDGNNDGGGAA